MHLRYKDLASDIYGRPEIPVMTLQTMDRRNIGVISNATPPVLSIKLAEPSEISFDVAAYSDGVPTPHYDKITGHKILYTETCGIYLLLEPEVEGDGVEEVKHVKGYSIEKELEHKSFFLEERTYNFYDPSNSTDPNTIIGSILDKADGWHIRYVSSSLYGRYRMMDEYDDYLLPFIYNTATEKYRCVFVFDPYDNMAIDVYDADEARKILGIYLDYDNLVTSLDIKELSTELVTAIRAYGADGLSVQAVNPIGTDWQYNLDYFIQNGDIPADTAAHWKRWQAAILNNQERYRGLVALNASELARRTLLQAELADLKSNLSGIIDRQNIVIQQMGLETEKGVDSKLQGTLDAINDEKTAVEEAIASKEEDIGMVDENIDDYGRDLMDLNAELAFDKTELLTSDEKSMLSKFFIEKDITQDGFVATDVDVDASGSMNKYSGLWVSISGSDISKADVESSVGSGCKAVYSMRGGTFRIGRRDSNGVIRNDIMRGNIIRATFDGVDHGAYILSIYGGDVAYEGSSHQSCVVTISGEADSYIDSDVRECTEEHGDISLTLQRGTKLEFDIGYDAEVYFTANLTDYQKMSVQMELFDYAADVLADLATPTYEFSVDTANFLFDKEFVPFRDVLELGSAIHLRISEDKVVTPTLIGVEVDFANLDKLSLTFSNRFKLHDSVNTLKDMLETGYSAGRTLDTSKYIYGRTVEKTTQVSKFMSSAFDVAKNAIVNAHNQSVRIDSAGIHVGGPNTLDESGKVLVSGGHQLRIINNMIAMTDDNWQHVKLAIGLFGVAGAQDANGKTTNQYWGVNAEVIGGRLIVGHNLIIENVNDMGVMQFKVDASGAFLNNGVLCIQTDAKEKGKLMIDPRYGIAAGTKNLYAIGADGVSLVPSFIDGDGVRLDADNMPENAMFYLDIRNGKAYFRGTMYAEDGVFNGIVYATGGEFDGAIKARSFLLSDGTNLKSFLNSDGKIDTDWLTLMGITVTDNGGNEVMTIDQTGIHIKKGEIAWTSDNAPVKYQFAQTLSGSWHDTMQTNDKYRRDSLDGGKTYGTPYQFKGTDGRNGSNGSDADVTFANIKAALQEAASTQTTFITADKMGAPNIYGGNIYGANLYVDGTKSTYAYVGAPDQYESGFYICMHGNKNPKVSLTEQLDGQFLQLILGAGSSNQSTTANRFFISKGPGGASLQYFSESGVDCGFSFVDGVITPIGTLNVHAVWAD